MLIIPRFDDDPVAVARERANREEAVMHGVEAGRRKDEDGHAEIRRNMP